MKDSFFIPPGVAGRLGYYVYLYVDPRSNRPFYVGKGQGQRVLAHLGVQNESRKSAVIAALRAEGKKPRIDILAHDPTNRQPSGLKLPSSTRWNSLN